MTSRGSVPQGLAPEHPGQNAAAGPRTGRATATLGAKSSPSEEKAPNVAPGWRGPFKGAARRGEATAGSTSLADQPPGAISTAARSHRSLTGAWAPTSTCVPAAGIWAVAWTQDVAPALVSTNSLTRV